MSDLWQKDKGQIMGSVIIAMFLLRKVLAKLIQLTCYAHKDIFSPSHRYGGSVYLPIAMPQRFEVQTGNAGGLNMNIEDSISISELSEKYWALLIENSNLKEEIRVLKARLAFVEARYSDDEIPTSKSESAIIASQVNKVSPPGLNKNADEGEKIRLFMSLFKGRNDVYAKRWENKKKGTSGYSPSCLNEWKPGLCVKPKGTCTGCIHKAYAALTEKVIDDHLRGKIVAGRPDAS